MSSVTIDTMPTNQLQTTKICLFCSGKVSRFKLLFRLCLLRRRLLRVGLPLTSFSPLPTPDTSPSSRFKSSRPWSRPATQTYQSTMTLWWKAGSGSPWLNVAGKQTLDADSMNFNLLIFSFCVRGIQLFQIQICFQSIVWCITQHRCLNERNRFF